MMDLIPAFEIGERVRVHYRQYEMVCPVCGGSMCDYDFDTVSEVVTITANAITLSSSKCKHKIPWPDGFYVVMDDEGGEIGVPYTLLEKLQED